MFTLQGNKPMGYLSRILTARFIGSAFRIGFMLCLLLTSVQACSRDQSNNAYFPSLVTYNFKDLNFRFPEGWTAKVEADNKNIQVLVVKENLEETGITSELVFFRYPSRKGMAPQNRVKKMISLSSFVNFNIEKEQLRSTHYYTLLFTYTSKKNQGRGIFYSYFDDQGGLVVLYFTAPRDRFESLGGAALPLVAFEGVDPNQVKPSGEFKTTVEGFPISSATATPISFPPLGLVNELSLRAPMHWTVSSNFLTAETKLSENLEDPASPLIMDKMFELDDLLTPTQTTLNFDPMMALMQGLATLNIQAVRQQEHVFVEGSNQRVFLAHAIRAGVPSTLTALYAFDLQKKTFDLVVFVAPTARYAELGGAMLIGVTLGAFDPATYVQATFDSLRPNAALSDAGLLTKTLAQNLEKAHARNLLIAELRLAKIQAEANMFTAYSNTINQINDNVANSVEPFDYYYDSATGEHILCSPSETKYGYCY